MLQKLFHITLVIFLAIISVTFIAFLLTGLLSIFDVPMLSGSNGIAAVGGGLSVRRFNFLVLAATVVICGVYFLWRRRRKT